MQRICVCRSPEVIPVRLRSTLSAADDQLAELTTREVPFARARIGSFFQKAPSLGNQFTADVTLKNYLKRCMPHEVYTAVESELEEFGRRVATDINALGVDCEQNPPTLKQCDAWGNRIDEIITCPSWKKQKEIAATEGLIAIAYERKYQQWSRLLQVAKLFLYAPSSGLFSCPLAMTDGAAKSLEVINNEFLSKHAYAHLTSRDPAQFWTSGQWMTERRGGSDVARATETIAIPQSDGTYRLHGYKWFTSATDSDIALTLARTLDANGQYVEGTKGLSMFFLEVRNPNGSLNNMQVQRLKDKLGTRQLPTAELLLDGTKAIKMETRAATLMFLDLGRLLGLSDCGMISDQDKDVFRLITPVAKLYTAKQSVAVTSEGLESFGGAGYLEDTNLPVFLRDAQVLPIWEGTTNILSLDVLRALMKTKGAALKSFHEDITNRLESAAENPELKECVIKVKKASTDIVTFAAQNMDKLEVSAREFAYSLARTYMVGAAKI